MDTMREGSHQFSRRSFLKKSLLGTGALALSQVPFGQTVFAATTSHSHLLAWLDRRMGKNGPVRRRYVPCQAEQGSY